MVAMIPEHSSSGSLIRISRRRLLAATATASALAATAHGPLAVLAQTPAATSTPAGPWKTAAAIPTNLATDASPRFKAVAVALKEAMVANGVPGAALGILMNGQEEHAVFGVANLAQKEPVTPDTLFQIGSLTKTYTGTATMRLIAQGKLDLYAPVRTYLPDFDLEDDSVAARVTVYHLLTHTAGWWGDAFFETTEDDDAIALFIQERMPTLPQIAPLGELVSYNNPGFIILGRIIEVVTGKPYRPAMQELLLDPLGMTASTFDKATVERGPYSLGYANTAGGAVPQTPLYLPRNVDPAGSLWSTTREQLRYARFHLANGVAPSGARLLPAYTVRLMRTAQKTLPGIDALQIGLPWFVQEVGGIRFAMHGGDTFGQHTEFLMAPDRGFALILLTNAQPGGIGVEAAVLAAAGAAYLGITAPTDQAQLGPNGGSSYVADGTPLKLTAAALAEYAGRYASPDMAFTLRVANNQLLLSAESLSYPGRVGPDVQAALPKDVAVPIVAGDKLAIGHHLVATFPRKPDGEIGWFGIAGRVYPKISNR